MANARPRHGVLVPVDRWDEARATLGNLGYAPAFAARHDPPHAAVQARPSDRMHIDLHRTLQGLTATPMQVWLELFTLRPREQRCASCCRGWCPLPRWCAKSGPWPGGDRSP
jgi:hypothetical protein